MNTPDQSSCNFLIILFLIVCCNVDAIYVEHLTNYFSDDQSETGTLNMLSSNLLDSPGTSTYVFIDSIISKMIFLVQVFSRHTT